jgi:hypothetical protein
MLIEVGRHDGKLLWIESSKVVGVSAMSPSMCLVNMACGEMTEEWQLCDNIDRVRRAVDEANNPGEARFDAAVRVPVLPPQQKSAIGLKGKE